jgi:hypothetical protein
VALSSVASCQDFRNRREFLMIGRLRRGLATCRVVPARALPAEGSCSSPPPGLAYSSTARFWVWRRRHRTRSAPPASRASCLFLILIPLRSAASSRPCIRCWLVPRPSPSMPKISPAIFRSRVLRLPASRAPFLQLPQCQPAASRHRSVASSLGGSVPRRPAKTTCCLRLRAGSSCQGLPAAFGLGPFVFWPRSKTAGASRGFLAVLFGRVLRTAAAFLTGRAALAQARGLQPHFFPGALRILPGCLFLRGLAARKVLPIITARLRRYLLSRGCAPPPRRSEPSNSCPETDRNRK